MDTELEIDPSSSRDDERFRVCALLEAEEVVREHFSHRYVYYVASHEGCGCGFEWDASDEDEDSDLYEEEWQAMPPEAREELHWSPEDQRNWVNARRQTARALEELVARLLQLRGAVEVGVFLDRDVDAPLLQQSVRPGDLSQGRPDVFPVVGTIYQVREG